jgi:hypothetical protein
MQQQFLLNEPVDELRLVYLFPTTDGVTGKTTGVAGNKAEITIGSAAFVETINPAVQFGSKPLYYVQLEASEVATLGHGIVYYKDASSVTFAGIFKVTSTSNAVSLDEVNSKIDDMRGLTEEISLKVSKVEQRTQTDTFVNPL